MTDELSSLRSAFNGKLLTGSDDTEPFLIDWRRAWRGVALGVVIPDSVEDVAAIVRWCAANGVAVVPQGGNTGQSGGSVPEAAGRNLVLSLTRLNRIRAIDAENDTMTVDAGCILQTVQDAATAADRLFPLSLGAEGSCTIGGTLATNAGGNGVVRYGNVRNFCLGLEVVTAAGEVWDGLKGLRKDNSGYDLRDLFIGSEGTLGVITGAVLKLFPRPTARATAFAGVPSVEAAMTLFNRVRNRHGAVLSAFEMMSDACVSIVLDHLPGSRLPLSNRAPWYVLVELSGAGDDAALQAALADALGETDAVIAASGSQARALWELRDGISPAQGANARAVKHDIAVPLSQIIPFVDAGLAAAAKAVPGAKPVIFGHLGDGNLHFNFSLPKTTSDVDYTDAQARLNRTVHDLVRTHDGTISAEHGLGVLRRDEADVHRSDVERTMMLAVKQAFDPQGIMNPGKMLPVR